MEEAGVSTTSISLVRPHTEIMRPPRALWVPFELGRPLGTPDNPAFQRKVLESVLKLLEAPAGPLLEDFPEDAPESSAGLSFLASPLNFSRDELTSGEYGWLKSAFRREVAAMRPWYDRSLAKRKRTTVGVSGIEIEAIGDFIFPFLEAKEPENPRKDIPLAYALKFAAEDLKSYYVEGVTAQEGQEQASSRLLQKWFWDETAAGMVLMKLKEVCQISPDKIMSMIGGHFLVPGEIARRKEKRA